MKTRRIQWVGLAMVAGTAIGVSTVSCENPSIWSVQAMVGLIPAECNANIDCDDKNDCTEDTCNAAGLCEYLILTEAPSCDDGNICTQDSCDPITARCEHEFDPTAIGSSPNSCRRMTCQDGDPKESVAPDGYECGSPTIPFGTGHCYQSVCVSCSDGIKNGDETDIDCGGFRCAACDDALNCNQNSDCLHGHCIQGLCCNVDCSDICYSCNLPGSVGTCTAVPLKEPDHNPDPEPKCTFPYLCDGKGDCKATVDQPCADANECLSGYCYGVTGSCQIDTGDPCEGGAWSCYTDYCDAGGMCAFLGIGEPCLFHDQCGPNRICYGQVSPTCKIADFAQCDPNFPWECATAYCNPNQICAKAPVTNPCAYNDQCASNNCNGGFCTAP